jgi:hypothetical protein
MAWCIDGTYITHCIKYITTPKALASRLKWKYHGTVNVNMNS